MDSYLYINLYLKNPYLDKSIIIPDEEYIKQCD